MTIKCPCGFPDPLPDTATEQQARQALRAVILWYQESPIREIQMADAACGIRFPLKAIEAALSATPGNQTAAASDWPPKDTGQAANALPNGNNQ